MLYLCQNVSWLFGPTTKSGVVSDAAALLAYVPVPSSPHHQLCAGLYALRVLTCHCDCAVYRLLIDVSSTLS